MAYSATYDLTIADSTKMDSTALMLSENNRGIRQKRAPLLGKLGLGLGLLGAGGLGLGLAG